MDDLEPSLTTLLDELEPLLSENFSYARLDLLNPRQMKLEIMYQELNAIITLNSIYWDHEFHSAVDADAYAQRIERLATVREKMKKLLEPSA